MVVTEFWVVLDMPQKIFLHIGLHKTGTTSLQRQLFPNVVGLNYLGVFDPSVKKFIDLVTKKDPIYFREQDARSHIENLLSDRYPNLISAESLSGPPFSGERELGLDHRVSVLLNIARVFPDANLIITLRRQDAFAISMYRQYLKFGGTKDIKTFFGIDNDGFGIFPRDRFDYSLYLKALNNIFESKVLILLFEEFVLDQDSYLKKLQDYLGVEFPIMTLAKSNSTRFGSAGLEVTRCINRFFNSKHNPGGLIPGIPLWRSGGFEWFNPMQYLQDHWPIRGRVSEMSMLHRVAMKILEENEKSNEIVDSELQLGMGKYNYYRNNK